MTTTTGWKDVFAHARRGDLEAGAVDHEAREEARGAANRGRRAGGAAARAQGSGRGGVREGGTGGGGAGGGATTVQGVRARADGARAVRARAPAQPRHALRAVRDTATLHLLRAEAAG